MSEQDEAGFLRGKHYTEYVEEVKGLKRQGDLFKAEQLLLDLVEAVEAEARHKKWGAAPWYYEQLAIIYRKRGDPQAEVQILERYANQKHAPGASPPEMAERLRKARERIQTKES